MSLPHGDVGVVANHLLRQHLHMDVGVVELLAHLSQLPHGVVQVAFALAPAGRGGRERSHYHIITQSHSTLFFCFPFPTIPSLLFLLLLLYLASDL